jgi:hypothetical protein
MRRIFWAGQGERLSATARNANEDNAALRKIGKQIVRVLDITEHEARVIQEKNPLVRQV